jgi:hypothetical protein
MHGLEKDVPRGHMHQGEAKISVEILANVFVETINDSQSEGGCSDQRSHRWREMDAMA